MTGDSRERTIYTVGHSAHPIKRFASLLERHRVDVVADVRSVPYSRRQPQFNRPDLRSALRERGVDYVFMGEEFGARSGDRGCYGNGRVKYRRLARTSLFRSGMERLREGLRRRRTIALMCAESDPAECHRTVLVARKLEERGVDVAHILPDGRTEPHEETMRGLEADLGLLEIDLFDAPPDSARVRSRAYEMQEERIAYTVGERGRGTGR